MIEYVKGELTELTPTLAVVECAGVGYGLSISLNTFSALQGKPNCKLYVHEAIRDDAYQLFGFYNKEERELFLLLNSVSGVGGNTARMILSALSPAELVDAIGTENVKLLQTVKGIGKKTAERLIVYLKDKVKSTSIMVDGKMVLGETNSPNMVVFDEAISALTMLGFAPAPTRKVVQALLQEDSTYTIEQMVKLALKRL